MAPNEESNIIEQVDNRLDDLFGDDVADEVVKDQASALLRAEKPLDWIPNDGEAAAGDAPDGFIESETSRTPENERAAVKIDAEEIENSPIKELKSTIMSLEWEISDSVMEKLEEEIRKLEILSQNDKIILAFLQLLGSLGKYIRQKRAQAHVDSITLLHSVYESLEKSMLSEDMSDGAKKKMLIAHVTQYKKLKQEIQSRKKHGQHAKPSARRTKASPSPSAGSDGMPFTGSHPREIPSDFKDLTHMTQEILCSMREIQQTIQNEFSIMRGEMRRLLEEKNS